MHPKIKVMIEKFEVGESLYVIKAMTKVNRANLLTRLTHTLILIAKEKKSNAYF